MEDKECGFEANDVRSSYTVSGEVGKLGRVQYEIKNCALDYTEQPFLSEDCAGRSRGMKGKARVSATIIVRGEITGNANAPIIPRSERAIDIIVHDAAVNELSFTSSDDSSEIILREGSVEFQAGLYSVIDDESGLCELTSGDLFIEGLNLKKLGGEIRSEEGDSYIYISNSQLSAQIGRGMRGENFYEGYFEVFDERFEFTKSESNKLDPDYERKKFEESFVCRENYRLPLDSTCTGPSSADEELVANASRAMIQSMLTVGELLESDEVCGGSSENSRASQQLSVSPGMSGTVTETYTRCVINLDNATKVLENCQKKGSLATGQVVVTGRKILKGIVTGDTSNPILPTNDYPVDLVFDEIEFRDFGLTTEAETSSTSSASAQKLFIQNGSLSGIIRPRFAKDTSETGVCSIQTPIADVRVSLSAVSANLEDGDGTSRAVRLQTGQLRAISGTIDSETNVLTGTVTLDSTTYQFPENNSLALVPNFTQSKFDESWQCAAELEKPANFECDPTNGVIDGALRLTPGAFASIVGILESDSSCGFANVTNLQQAISQGAVGDVGEHTVTISNCVLEFDRPTVVSTDCNGDEVIVSGRFEVSGSRTVTGFLTGDADQPVIPTSRTASDYELNVRFSDFQLEMSDSDIPTLAIPSGQVQFKMLAQFAYSQQNQACVLPTPMVRLRDVEFEDAQLNILNDEQTAGVLILSSDIQADTSTVNQIAGTVTTSVATYQVPIDGRALNPDFDLAAFRASYECNQDLTTVTDDQICSFREALAGPVARLLTSLIVEAVSQASSDSTCGFASSMVMPISALPASPPVGPPVPGLVVDGISQCIVSSNFSNPLREDCLRNSYWSGGSFTVTATRSVRGLRLEQPIAPGIAVQYALPVTSDAIDISVSEISFDQFATYQLQPGQTSSEFRIEAQVGSASFIYSPLMGENVNNSGVMNITTPLARISNLRILDAPITATIDGKTFNLTITKSNLQVEIGRYEGAGNQLAGSMTLDGQRINFMADEALDPNYNQVRFDLSYDCTPDLRSTLSPN